MQAGTRLGLLITDIGLPGGVSGRVVAEAARERYPDLPIILITGYAGGQEVSGKEVVTKPFEPQDLMELVQARVKMASRPHQPPRV